MKENEVLEGNRLIAEFMGWVHSVKNHHGINLFHLPEGDKIPLHCKQQSLEGFKYHSSWDWLMPIVEKVEAIFKENRKGVFQIDHYSVFIGFGQLIITQEAESKITAVYKAVVEFIKWHNLNK